jgi:poly-gamma-glutamate synthesis protein (capsule biosynthesis protein)
VSRTARARIRAFAAAGIAVLAVAGCTSTGPAPAGRPAGSVSSGAAPARQSSAPTSPPSSSSAPRRPGAFTINFAGDVHFMNRVGTRLDRNPRTVFGRAQPGLADADLTMVNLETAITNGHGTPQNKEFTFQAPPVALSALRDAGVDVATMANNHGADYGPGGLADTLAAIKHSGFPVIGIGRNAKHAFAPYTATLNGTKVAIIAADQVQDETTLSLFSAGAHKRGVANAFSAQLVRAVRQAKAAGYLVIVYLHWGVELQTCPSSLQTGLAGTLAAAGATAVIGTHAHVLQGAGWRPDGTYVAYGLGNYLWWESFGNNQDDNGVLTLTFRHDRVVRDRFAPSHLDDQGVPVPATGAERQRIRAEWDQDRSCTDLSGHPPRRGDR